MLSSAGRARLFKNYIFNKYMSSLFPKPPTHTPLLFPKPPTTMPDFLPKPPSHTPKIDPKTEKQYFERLLAKANEKMCRFLTDYYNANPTERTTISREIQDLISIIDDIKKKIKIYSGGTRRKSKKTKSKKNRKSHYN